VSPRIVGLDLSIASTGWATIQGGTPILGQQITGSLIDTGVFKSDPPKGLAPRSIAWYRNSIGRTEHLCSEVSALVRGADLVVIETPALYAKGNALDRMFAVWWMVLEAVDAERVPWAPVIPQQIKMYATGKGTAAKEAVLAEVIHRFPGRVGGFDEADALTAAAMGADHLGCPIAEMPAKHRAALARVEWPEITTAVA
jgi:crossover junction endodeoxyribonuclease RuvC